MEVRNSKKKTPQHPASLLVQVELIAAVCDYPEIQKLIGYTSHSATKLSHGKYSKFNPTIKNQKLEKDQIKFKVVDPKNLISGILELHSQTVWGLEKKQWISSRNKKKQIDHLNKNVDQFSEDDYEKWLEKEKNPLENNNRIKSNHKPSFKLLPIHLMLLISQHTLPSIFGDAYANWIKIFTIFIPFIVKFQKSSQSESINSWYHLESLMELAMDYVKDENKAQRYLFHLTS
ncbi:uncharacterized protein VP01_1111g1 [Puccinia sorghi]|uniref:Uncharacterized protein n=1 Tax=Puccinia sorghi TaxID=27349 RepID=A0A0L6VU10_9BASI|nr:uncharacterized protein VP01_1111g1 [Puccinia sorghi]